MTKTFPYGTTRKATCKAVDPGPVTTLMTFLDDQGEGHV